ncbi:putative Golgin IMH1 [Amylocarpus encephaloides]|uniref:Golgin IMH1 n=1 Tax=Amylocarpus encephaloides TaxID=45428 RepID=A0A9P7YDN2_9HELO|nr:putative Golgin IMH1 [Amylocarpus encephaloides]
MFQRIKGAIDSRIAEEQARQKTAGGSSSPVSRSNSTVKRSSSRTESPSTRPRRAKPKDGDGSPARGPDPSEFESAFVIEDESEETASATSVKEKADSMADTSATPEAKASGDGKGKGTEMAAESPTKASDLPADVRAKLQRLENLQSKYKELLRSYRVAHSRAVSIEPFEKALKENTPLATISDPDALVEYLSQLSLKGDMVMDELKRVSADRDNHKKRFEDAEKETIAAREQIEKMKASPPPGEGSSEKVDTLSIVDTMSNDTPSASVKSPVSSVLNLFSPKQKPQATSDNKDVSEEFFSYDDEIPKLQAEVKEKTMEVESLKSKVGSLEEDLAVAQESSTGLVENLEKATRELNESKDAITAGEDHLEKIKAQTQEIMTLKDKLDATEKKLSTLGEDLESQRKESAEKFSSLENTSSKQKEIGDRVLDSERLARRKLDTRCGELDTQIKELEKSHAADAKKIQELSNSNKSLMEQLKETGSHIEESESQPADASCSLAPPAATGGGKKRNKKKKKGANAAATTAKDGTPDKEPESAPPTPSVADSQAEIARLKEEVVQRDAQIERLQKTRKIESDLREELENMQDNFLSIGQEHVEAKEMIKETKEKIKELEAEKTALQGKISTLEKEIDTYKSQSKDSNRVAEDFKSLTAEYEDLRLKSATLQSDLGAAQQLATSRYRDLTDLRDVLQKAQPELKTLRAEGATLKSTKDELSTRTSELRRLEVREKGLRSDVNSFKKQAADREGEIRTLHEKVTQETNGRLRAEDQARVAQRDMRKSEAEKIQLAASGEKSADELAKVQEEAGKLRSQVRDLEDQVAKLTTDSKGLREEADLRGSQYNNAQGLLDSMRDQSAEMAMQLKEAKDQSESLEEELAEVQRLLSERTREGETMRRLLADVDDRADAKVREMRERTEAAIEERDRAEDEASTNGRRKAREVEELKSKIRDFERDLKRAIDDRDELQHAEKEWKRRRDGQDEERERFAKEVHETRSAMGELRNALDGSEKQVRDAEKQRSDLRRLLDEANQRHEKLSKEFKSLQVKSSKMNDVSSRSSIDSGSAGSALHGSGGPSAGKMDYVYIKTILLQFLEQKDRKRQADLVKTVLGQLLRFDQKDQEKWIAAISAR